jgi:hypothetical protein
MVTGLVIMGSSEAGEMDLTPVPGMLNVIVSAPVVSFDSWIAALKVHWLPAVEASTSHTALARLASGLSPVRFTVNVAALGGRGRH